MPTTPPPPPRKTFRFALPPSLGTTGAGERAPALQQFLGPSLGLDVEVIVAPSYELLAKDLLAGRTDAAWAPPFVCARVEAMAARVVTRGVRKGASSYRAALVTRKDSALTVDTLRGSSASWVDKDSVGGHLLAIALLKSKNIDPAKTFFAQDFSGSYRASLEAVLASKADVASVFAASGTATGAPASGADEVLPGSSGKLRIIAYSDESPNDGVVVSPNVEKPVVDALERALLALSDDVKGRALLSEVFSVDRFEPAPRMGYRALYRVAMASL